MDERLWPSFLPKARADPAKGEERANKWFLLRIIEVLSVWRFCRDETPAPAFVVIPRKSHLSVRSSRFAGYAQAFGRVEVGLLSAPPRAYAPGLNNFARPEKRDGLLFVALR